MKKILKWGLISLAIIIVLGALFSSGDEPVATEASDSSTSSGAQDEPAEPAEPKSEPAPEPEPEPEPEPSLTSGQENALNSAMSYLSYTSFSKSGLIKQLKFEGYSKADATFAVNQLDVNWKEQAAQTARDYLSYTSFSRSGLIEQLEFEGYTRAQAVYGADQAL